MQDIKIQFYNFRIDDGFEKLDTTNQYDLVKEFNLKTIIFDVKKEFNLNYIDNNEIVFIFFSHSILDVSNCFNKFNYFSEIKEKLQKNVTKKVVFFCEDMDWCRLPSQGLEAELNFINFFGEHLSKIKLTLANRNWSFEWKTLNVTYNLGCLPYVLKLNIKESKLFDLDNINRKQKLFTLNNEPRGVRLYFYKYLIDNNLLDNFDASFFFKFQHKQFINWDNVEGGGDTLPPISDVFPVLTFNNENNNDYYKKIKIMNFEKSINSYMDVVIETSIFDREFFGFSEKSFKSIISKKPFIIYGSHRNYKGLKELGFKTYDELIDVDKFENGFEEWQVKERMYYFFECVKSLAEKDISWFKTYYSDKNEIIEYNHRHLIQLLNNEYNNFYKLIAS